MTIGRAPPNSNSGVGDFNGIDPLAIDRRQEFTEAEGTERLDPEAEKATATPTGCREGTGEAKHSSGLGAIMVKHPESLREEDDGGDILHIWWRLTRVYVAEAKEAMQRQRTV